MATIKIKHLLQKAGLLYYSRRIPEDLKRHYSGRNLIRINLKTLDLTKAARLCAQFSARDDILWASLRSGLDPDLTTTENRAAADALLAFWGTKRGARLRWDDPHDRKILEGMSDYFEERYGVNYVSGPYCYAKPEPDYIQNPIEHEAVRLLYETPDTRLFFLSDALERYLLDHKNGRDVRFSRDTSRAIGVVVTVAGDLPLQNYTREHARAVRDALVPGHSTATVRRRLDSISAVFNLGRREFDLLWAGNPFEKLAIAREGLDSEKRLPFSHDELRMISAACREADDDIRWIVALQLATGARLGEIVGLRCEDLFLDHEVPHINIRPHEALGRSLKTPGSERVVPLLGIGLWAAKRAMREAGETGWLFPRYAKDGDIRATHASNTINKWISETLGIPKTSHSFRHSFRDMLREAGVSEEVAKTLLGHGSRSISDQYGQGFTLQRLKESMDKVLARLP